MKLAAGGDEAGFQNLLSPVAGPQARRRDVGPGLRFAGQQGCADLQAISLDECRCLTGLNLWREGGKAMTKAPRNTMAARAEKDLNMWGADFGSSQPHRFRGFTPPTTQASDRSNHTTFVCMASEAGHASVEFRAGAATANTPAANRLAPWKAALAERSVNFINTADSYGPETNESVISQALHPYPRVWSARRVDLSRPRRSWKG